MVVFILSPSCGPKRSASPLSQSEIQLIESSDSVMRVYTIKSPEDSALLRRVSVDFTDEDLKSEAFSALSSKMVRTVTDPSQDGVGIAGPQVGLNRRIVAVQRFDKKGAPFEVYPNARLDSLYGETVKGREGCLSVPDCWGIVPRRSEVIVSYKDPLSLEAVRDTVKGFTAIIFQHEIDHLDGILYIDKADSLFVNEKK